MHRSPFVVLPGNTSGVKASRSCAGPAGDGWDWEHPGGRSDRYACTFGHINPGATVWYDLVVEVRRDREPTPGYIKLALPGNDSQEPIVVTMDSLPVTGFPVGTVAAAGAFLLLAGAGLAVVTRRRRR